MLSIFILIFLFITTYVSALGISVSPVKYGQSKQMSSISNLHHCVTYETNVNDIIFVTVKTEEKLPSQILNLNIFDSDSNQLRNQKDIGQREIELIISHANNKYREVKSSKRGEAAKKTINICFDNVYTDMSWSFTPADYEVELFVDIKKDMKDTNYDLYRKYFSKSRKQTEKFTQENLDTNMEEVKQELNAIVEKLESSESILRDLMDQEYKLRDVNEEIYSGYTIISIVVLSFIVFSGLIQLIYFKCYLKKRKLL
ncbi:uncharacterized protein SPAPADRAFT_58744 [Spathaspora passalidarum NRRL Y-27907]|uniref:GOLD domain-containing protein n=1 Tax=Spathaspora passalidarum (strain NRRL Y-27907 / 11-Y1) TaxID=619300 RepID=G3AH75_SPAPN|nr:uncharacterized protein SPAPADRAFT_58744 [Spathaspora passalidarum NRRL Y-27907]EGW35505.1 hypothetical protein SPAPADRAFT_58744 [Spathaspora passalidarum NRRL Y-27907]